MKKTVIALLVSAASPFIQAQDYSTAGKTHSFEAGVGLADVSSEYDKDTYKDYFFDVLRYHYQFNDDWALGLAHLSGDTNEITFFIDNVRSLRNVDYRANMLTVKRAFDLSTRWRFFTSLGLNHHNVEHSGRHLPEYHHSGVGFNGSAGVQFRAHNGFGLAFEYHYLDMGKAEVKGPALMLSWMF